MIVTNKYYFRKLKQRKNLDKNLKIVAFDCEYDAVTNAFKLVSISQLIHLNNKFTYITKIFFSISEFIDYIISKKYTLIYSFNLFADLRFLLKEIINRNYQYKMIESSKLLGCVIKIDKIKIIFKDFFCFALTSLESFSKSLQCETKKFPENLSENELEQWFKTCSIEDLQHHCENDTKILCECIFKFRKLIFEKFHVDFMNVKIYSLASLSMKIFQTNFLQYKLQNSFFDLMYNINKRKYSIEFRESDYDFVRKSYKGGYTDCFSNKVLYNVDAFDINSAHPHSATKIAYFPVGRGYLTSYFKEFELKTRKIHGFCEVEIDFSSNKKYYIPVLVEENSETKFKRCFTTIQQTITSIEMRYLMQHDIKFKFIKGMYFRTYDRSFALKRFYESVYNDRKQLDEENPMKLILKIIMTSLYGKFGQKIKSERIEHYAFSSIEQAIEFCDNNESNDIQQVNDLFIVHKKFETITKKSFMFVSWASLITAQTRIQLLDMIQRTNAIYCDTDSVRFEHKYYPKNFAESNELGGWKHEKTYLEFHAIAPKIYAGKFLKENKEKIEIKAKGIQKKYREQLYEIIINYVDSEIEIENINKSLSYRECCRNITSTYCYDNFVKVLIQNKKLKPKLKYSLEELLLIQNNQIIESKC